LRRPPLSRTVVDRDEELRRDTDRLRDGWPTARILVIDEKGRAPIEPTGSGYVLATRAATDYGAQPPDDATFLGQRDKVHHWAVRGHPSPADDDPAQWKDLRTGGGDLDDAGAGLMVTAVALLAWHDRAGFCARCGSPTRARNAGWLRRCTAGAHDEYPRTDPAIICLVHDGGRGDTARLLLARPARLPPGRYSVLAGFVEAGESLEACVAREIGEEVGLDVHQVRYLGSQPWPMPRSLMLGFEAVADPEQPLRPADGEIAEAFWISRSQLRQALAHGDWMTDTGRRLQLSPSISIARSMMDSWAAAD
jgi:NAD+ diphosphatase